MRAQAPRWFATVVAILVPARALAHGPPEWLFVPTGVWLLFSLFILFVGSGVVVAARRTSDRARLRERTLAVRLAIALAGGGAVLAVLLLAQGPWSVPVAVAVAVVSIALSVFAFFARNPRPRPR